MKIAIGYSFTEGPVENLHKRGFHLENGQAHFPTPSQEGLVGFEVHVVLDETERPVQKSEHPFWPRLDTIEEISIKAPHKNGVEKIKQALFLENIESRDLRVLWETRKFGSLVALWLTCRNLEDFQKIAHPDREIQWQGKKAFLIEMGPNCFDFVITES